MLMCPFQPNCDKKAVNVALLTTHLKLCHRKEWKIPYRCGQNDCFATYDRSSCWKRHVERDHSSLCRSLPLVPEENDEDTTENEDPQCEDLSFRDFIPEELESTENEPTPDLQELRESIRVSADQFVASLRASSSVTISTCELAVNACNDVTESIVNYLKFKLCHFLVDQMPDCSQIKDIFDEFLRPLEHLSTEKKQNLRFSKQSGFVKPERKVFGPPRFEPRNSSNEQVLQKKVYDEWQYISIGNTIASVLSIPELLKQLSTPQTSNEAMYSEFRDGELCSNHPLLNDKTKTVAALQLYYDDAEVANPLSPNAGLHKQGLFYFTIRNLPPYFTSNMANIHLTAIGKTTDFKQYGYDQVLKTIADELNSLATKGIEVESPDGSKIIVHACLIAVNGDNLGRHTILGLVESFRATHFCSQCMAENKEIQSKFYEKLFITRTEEDYKKQLQEVLNAKASGVQSHYDEKVKEYGIKIACPLNNISGWHLTKNQVGDLMHDFLEGIGPYEVKLVLHHFVHVQKIFTLEQLKRRIGLFPYGPNDVKSRPREILNLSDIVTNNDKTLKQTALDFWCLFRLLPQLIGDFIPPGNAYWEFYLDLRRIADILFSQKWTKGSIAYYEQLYGEHLLEFKRLFPNFRLIPKHHMLIHYGTYARNTGPPYMSMVAPEDFHWPKNTSILHTLVWLLLMIYDPIRYTGYLEYFISNQKRTLKRGEERLLQRKEHSKTPEQRKTTGGKKALIRRRTYNAAFDQQTDPEEAECLLKEVNDLKPNGENDGEIISKMEQLSGYRRNWINSNSSATPTEIIRKFPRFSDFPLLILSDYKAEVQAMGGESTGFVENWQKAVKFILQESYGGAKRVSPTQQLYLEKFHCTCLNDVQQMDKELQSQMALILLPSVIKPTPISKQNKVQRMTHLSAVQRLVHFKKSSVSLNEAIDDIKKDKDLTQPFLLIFTQNGSPAAIPNQIFLVIDFRGIELTNMMGESIYYMFASYFCFNTSYPAGLEQVFYFFELLDGHSCPKATSKARELAIQIHHKND